jgi:hypothetical protein
MAPNVRPALPNAESRCEIVVVFDTKDTKRAKDFAASPDLRETMAKAGSWTTRRSIFLNRSS